MQALTEVVELESHGPVYVGEVLFEPIGNDRREKNHQQAIVFVGLPLDINQFQHSPDQLVK